MRALLIAALLAALYNAQEDNGEPAPTVEGETAETGEEAGETGDTGETGETGEAGEGETGADGEGAPVIDQGPNYKENGADWGTYEPFCDIGKEQSPIDLNAGAVDNDKMEINGYGYMNYPDGKFIELKDDTLQMDFTDGEFQLTFPDGSMSLFEPLKVVFRSPSEHTVEGKHHDLEMQIIH